MALKIFKLIWLMSTFAACVVCIWDDGKMIFPIINSAGFILAFLSIAAEENEED